MAKPKEIVKALAPKPGKNLVAMLEEAVALETRIIARAEEHAGEVDPELDEYLRRIGTDIAAKVDSYKFVMDQLETQADLFDAQWHRLRDVAERLRMTRELMRDRVRHAIENRGLRELGGETWRFQLVPTSGELEIGNQNIAQLIEMQDNAKTVLVAALRGTSGLEEDQKARDAREALLGFFASPLGVCCEFVVKIDINRAAMKSQLGAGTLIGDAAVRPGFSLRTYVQKPGRKALS